MQGLEEIDSVVSNGGPVRHPMEHWHQLVQETSISDLKKIGAVKDSVNPLMLGCNVLHMMLGPQANDLLLTRKMSSQRCVESLVYRVWLSEP